MKVIITGGTGFVGLAVAEHLIASGHDCTLFARSPLPEHFRQALPGARVIRGDVSDSDAVDRFIQAERADVIIHLAAVTPDREAEMCDPAGIVTVNVAGTANVMRAAGRAQPKPTVLLASSVAVYGADEPPSGSFREDEAALNPVSLYGVTKLAAEKTSLRLAQLYDIDLRIVRIGPVYGPWEYASGLRPLLSPQSQILHIWNTGREAVLPRPMFGDWLYSRDAASALSMLALAPRLQATTFNLGGGTIWSVADWCARMEGTPFGSGWRLANAGEQANVQLSLVQDRAPLNIERLLELTRFRPRFTGDTAIQDHVDWLARYAGSSSPCAQRTDDDAPQG